MSDTTAADALLAAASPGQAHRLNDCARCDAEGRLAALAPEVTAYAIAAVKALEKLHDGADNMNVELCEPGRYCKLCFADTYDPQEGVVHKEGCAMRDAREALALWATLRWGKEAQ